MYCISFELPESINRKTFKHLFNLEKSALILGLCKYAFYNADTVMFAKSSGYSVYAPQG